MDGADDDYDGDQTGASVDRSGIRWSKLQVESSGNSLSCAENGIFYDTASSNPYWYYCPSIMVSAAQNQMFGFSLSRGTEYIGAAYVGRTFSGTFSGRVQMSRSGEALHNFP